MKLRVDCPNNTCTVGELKMDVYVKGPIARWPRKWHPVQCEQLLEGALRDAVPEARLSRIRCEYPNQHFLEYPYSVERRVIATLMAVADEGLEIARTLRMTKSPCYLPHKMICPSKGTEYFSTGFKIVGGDNLGRWRDECGNYLRAAAATGWRILGYYDEELEGEELESFIVVHQDGKLRPGCVKVR